MDNRASCPNGHQNPVGYNFCTQCGEKIAGGMMTCPNCGATNDSGAGFCGGCGKSLKGDKHVEIKGMKWQRGVDDFATTVEVNDLEGTFKKGLIVEQGTKALLFINGAHAETLIPGKYDLGGISDKLRNFDLTRSCTAILIDSGDLALDFHITDIYTKDPLTIDTTCSVVIQIETPAFFFNNLMKGKKSYRISELRSSLYDEMGNALNEMIRNKSVEELNSDLTLKRHFEVTLENHLKATFERNGLGFIQLRTMDYQFREYDKVRGIQVEGYLQISQEEAKLQNRKRLFDLYNESQLQEIYEETKKTDHYRKRVSLKIDLARIKAGAEVDLKSVEDDKKVETWKLAADTRKRLKEHLLDKTKTDDEIEQFMLEIEKAKLLRERELTELKQMLSEKDEDREMKRNFMLKKLELEQELDYERTKLKGKGDLDLERVELEEKKKRMQLESEISNMKIKRDAEREEELKTRMEKIKVEKAEDLADLETAKVAQELLMTMKRRKAELELDVKRQNSILELDTEAKRLDMKLKSDKALHDQKLEEKRIDQDHELKKMAALSEASAEALISMSDSDQARMIKELKETEALKDLSEESILAMTASKSPEVAKAFQEKYKGMSKEETERVYKLVIEEKDKSAQEKDKIMAEAMDMTREMFNKSLETQRDVSLGATQRSAPNVVYPPSGQPGMNMPSYESSTPGGGEVILCTKCKIKVPPGQKFCNNCGNEMY